MLQLSICLILLVVIYRFYEIYKRSKRIEGIDRKAVLVTGCDSGLGLEMARYLHHVGFIVIGTCLTTESTGYKYLNSIQEDQKRLRTVILDITDESMILKTEKQIRDFLKSLNINGLYGLVNNAGVLFQAEFDWLTWPQCETQINVNFTGTIRMTKLFLQDIIDSKGRIIFVSSLISNIPFPLATIYCATKSGLASFAEGLQAELAKFGVKIVLMEPGDFTKMTDIVETSLKSSKAMWDQMNVQQRERYGKYFFRYYQSARENVGIISFNSYEESPLHQDIEEALCSLNPRPIMVQSFLWYHIIIRIISFLPRNLRILTSQFFQYLTRKGLTR